MGNFHTRVMHSIFSIWEISIYRSLNFENEKPPYSGAPHFTPESHLTPVSQFPYTGHLPTLVTHLNIYWSVNFLTLVAYHIYAHGSHLITIQYTPVTHLALD